MQRDMMVLRQTASLNFKHYYLFFIKGTMKSYFPKAVAMALNSTLRAMTEARYINLWFFSENQSRRPL